MMNRAWDINKVIKLVDGDAVYNNLYEMWMTEYLDSNGDEYMSFQHWVQINYRPLYNKYLTYARLQGWV